MGYPGQALETSRDAVNLADSLAHPFTTAYALSMSALVHRFYGKVLECRELAEVSNALCTEHRIPYWFAWGPILRGWALTEQGQRPEGKKQLRQGLAAYSATGAEIGRPVFLGLLAEAYLKGRQATKGLAVVAEALDMVHRTGDSFGEPELHRIKGELLSALSSNSYPEAESCFRQALDVSRRQNAKSFELRAAMSLSRLWQKQGREAEARDLLGSVYGWFTDGFDSPDLVEAGMMLDQPV